MCQRVTVFAFLLSFYFSVGCASVIGKRYAGCLSTIFQIQSPPSSFVELFEVVSSYFLFLHHTPVLAVYSLFLDSLALHGIAGAAMVSLSPVYWSSILWFALIVTNQMCWFFRRRYGSPSFWHLLGIYCCWGAVTLRVIHVWLLYWG